MQTIGKYEVLDKIGTGGFAIVYKGYDPFIKRPVAVKVCFSRDDETRKRFHREAEIAGRLVHRNITTVYDFGLHEEMPFLVEEYLSGEDLAHMIRRREPSHLAEKLAILLQIADGLAFAHGRGVVHRDIKPGNLRVLDSGRVKIMDFGTAKLTGAESSLTKTGMTLGTVAYLAPERMRGKPATPASDIFSLGVVAYELLAFCRPFEADNVAAMIEQVLGNEPRPLAAAYPDCPPRLAALIERCLAREPADRFAACGELIAALTEVQDDLVAQSAPAEPGSETDANMVPKLLERVRSRLAEGRRRSAATLLQAVLEIAPDNDEALALAKASRLERAPAADGVELDDTWNRDPALARQRQIAEAEASIRDFIAAGRLAEAADALDFAVDLYGSFDSAATLRQEIGEAEDLATADPGAAGEGEGEDSVAREHRRDEAIATIEHFIDLGQPDLATEALRFARDLFGGLDGAAELERRIADLRKEP